MTREIKADTQEIRNDTSAIKEDTTQILAEIARLQARLPEDERVGGANGFALQRYLDHLTNYAESSWGVSDIDSNEMVGIEPPISSSPSTGYNFNIPRKQIDVYATRAAEVQPPDKNFNATHPAEKMMDFFRKRGWAQPRRD